MPSQITPTMDISSPDDYTVEYDFSPGARSQVLKGVMKYFPAAIISVIIPLIRKEPIFYIVPGVLLFLSLTFICREYSLVYNQKCVITSTDICGVMDAKLFTSKKRLPLDTVLEVKIIQGCVDSMFNICVIHIETTAHETEYNRTTKRYEPVPEGVLIAPVNAKFIQQLILTRRDARRKVGGTVGMVQLPLGTPTISTVSTVSTIPTVPTAPIQTASQNPYPMDPYGYKTGMTPMVVAPMQPVEYGYGMNPAPSMPQYPPIQQQQPLLFNNVPLQQYPIPYGTALPGQQLLPYNTNPYTTAPAGQQPLVYNTYPSFQQEPLPYALRGVPESPQQELERLRAQVAHLEENRGGNHS